MHKLSARRDLTVERGGFHITHTQRCVIIERYEVPDEEFQFQLAKARAYLIMFPRSTPGTDWGCDGVSYQIQKNRGHIRIHRSGVGPLKFRQGLLAIDQALAEGMRS